MTVNLSEFRPDMIIWSADVQLKDIRRVVNSGILPEGTVIKLDRLFFETHPKNIITEIQSEGYPVFVDAKIIEIPDKSLAIAETYLKYNPYMLNIMAGACSTGILEHDDIKKVDALKRFADACLDAGTKSCVVTVLTSKSVEICRTEFRDSPLNQVLGYVKMANDSGITDIVCSPMETEAIRGCSSPGVRQRRSGSYCHSARRTRKWRKSPCYRSRLNPWRGRYCRSRQRELQ